MPTALSGGGRIRTNTPAENAFNALTASNANIASRQLRLSTGKRINSAADDVAGYITSRALISRVGSLKSALNAVGDAQNVSAIAQDSFDNINQLVTRIKDGASTAASGALGTDEKVSIAQASARLVDQIQSVIDSSVFGGRNLIDGTFSADFIIGFTAENSLLSLSLDLTTSGNPLFYYNMNASENTDFAGIEGLDLSALNSVSTSDLGVFSTTQISTTLTSLANALNNVNKTAAYVGGIVNRLDSQEQALRSQITNFNSAVSRIEDADVALEQLELIKAQFLQQTSITSLAQANQNPTTYLQLLG